MANSHNSQTPTPSFHNSELVDFFPMTKKVKKGENKNKLIIVHSSLGASPQIKHRGSVEANVINYHIL